MARNAVAAEPEMIDEADSAIAALEDYDACDEAATAAALQAATTQRPPPIRLALAFGLAVCVLLAGLAGWLGWRAHQAEQANATHSRYLEVGKQAAVNLTTIGYTEVDADVKRILDSATGTFYDDFQQRAQPFADVVKQARSKSEGTVTAAGLESVDGNQAQVLVAVTVKTSMNDGPQQDPRGWRMRIGVTKVDDDVKVSNVEFVP